LTQASGGSITGIILPAEQAGRAINHYAMVSAGAVDLAFVNPGFDRARFPLFTAGELPLLFANAGAGSRAFDTWYRPLAAREMPGVRFCAAFLFGPATLHGTKPLAPLSAIQGMVVRPTHPGIASLLTRMGMVELRGRAEDIRPLLSDGRAQATTFPWGSVEVFGLTATLTHHLDMPLYVTPFAWVMSEAAYERLGPTQRRALDDHCNSAWAERIAAPFAALEESGRPALMTATGHVTTTPSAAERALWIREAQTLHREWEARMTERGHPAGILAALKDDLARVGAIVAD
ncbi:MAG: C4-dicarboxylate ABC transporter, partial [Alphaproteobacteria bacterium]